MATGSIARAAAIAAFLLANSAAAAAPLGWVLDQARSDAEFEVHMLLPFRSVGTFSSLEGELAGDAASGWRVAVRIDARSLRFDGPKWMDAITRSPAFLDVDEFPRVALAAGAVPDRVMRHGGDFTGELTLRGRTLPTRFEVLAPGCARPGFDCDLLVQGKVSRRAFGMTGYRLSVRDGVDVRVRLRWRRATGP